MLVLLCCSSAVWLCGCRKAAVEPYQAALQTRVLINDPAYVLRPANETQAPWHRGLQVVFDSRPEDEKEMNAIIADRKPVASQAEKKLLDQIQDAVQARRKPRDKWSLLTLSIGRARKAQDIVVSAEVVQTRLYAKRPAIAFDNLPLELCVGKLAREADLLYDMPRGHNPFIDWSKTDVSVYEALEELLPAHGYEPRFKNAIYRINLRIEDQPVSKEAKGKPPDPARKNVDELLPLFPTRADFVRAAADAILEKGNAINLSPAAVKVLTKEASPPPPETKDKTPAPAPPPQPDLKPDFRNPKETEKSKK